MFSHPAIGKDFFGRDAVLDVLAKRVCALKAGYRQNVALTGQMLSGKSSILHHFLHSLKDTSLIPIYVEVTDEPFSNFSDKFIATLLYNYLNSENRVVKKELEYLVTASEALIPRTVGAIKDIRKHLAHKHSNIAYRNLLNLTSVFKEETQKACIVILDEFHNIAKFKIKNPFLHFGKIIMLQKNTMYIVSSSQRSTIRKILSEKLALLFGNFEIIEISGFDSKTAKAFLDEKLYPFVSSMEYKDYLIDFTDGNPFYLDVICKKIKELMQNSSQESLNPLFIEEAFVDILFNTNGTINQYLNNQLNYVLEKRDKDTYIDLLLGLANGCNKQSDIRLWLKRRDKKFSRRLDDLVGMDFVYKTGVFYELHDKVFEFWLKYVYYPKKTALIDNLIESADEFRNSVKSGISKFSEDFRKPVSERIRDLCTSFNHELVEIDRKVRRLPSFIKIEFLQYDGKDQILSCSKENKYWVFQIKEKRIDENDILNFIDASLNLKEKLAQRVIIGLGGIDDSALLLAKEKKIWLWDLVNLNKLLRIYKKHNLIV